MKQLSKMKVVCLGLAITLLSGCASTSLMPQATRVMVSPNAPASGCTFVGEVTGSQGNMFTGKFTSNADMESGALNDLRNQATKMGGNYVQLLTNRAGTTEELEKGRGSSLQTNVTDTGVVYRCQGQNV